MKNTCAISKQTFEISDQELDLRAKFGFADTLPNTLPKYRFQHLGAFWPQWHFHKRKCNKTGKQVISIFSPECPYPVWDRKEWFNHSNPPEQDFDFKQSFFQQAWALFQKSPIPHIFQSNNENCEYTDDFYNSKNCYLCHSGQNNEDCRYCYGCDGLKDVYYSIFSFDSELCIDLINSSKCFNSRFLLNSKNCSDSSFLYDCRNCSDCLLCSNLRNKKYCIANKQLTKTEYEQQIQEWDFASDSTYQYTVSIFEEMMEKTAWHKNLEIEQCENSTGNFLRNCKNCENCYMISNHEDCANTVFSGPNAKNTLDSLGNVGSELVFNSCLAVYSYNAQFCFSVDNCRFTQYSAYLKNCQYCFACCGLVNKKYCILNKQYKEEEYHQLVEKITKHMRSTGEWGQFFPSYFAANPYNESYSGVIFPLEASEKQNFRQAQRETRETSKTAEISEIPDNSSCTNKEAKWLSQQVFWDIINKRPFQIQAEDIKFAQKIKSPLPRNYYIGRMKRNLKWMNLEGELRITKCSKFGTEIKTHWPEAYDHHLLSKKAYLEKF